MRGITLALGAGLVLAACGGSPATSSSPGTSATVQPATIKVSLPGLKPAFSQSDIAVADANGFFKEQKLTVQTQGLASGVQTVQSVLAGDSDIGAASVEPVLAAAATGGLTIIGSYADRLPVVVETPDSIARPADLKGKQLGIQSVGAFREIMMRAVYQGAGLTKDDVSYVTVADTGYVSALLTHKIDAAILQQEQSIDTEAKDTSFHVLADLYKTWPQYYYGTFFVKSDWLQSNRGVAVRFLTALTRAHRLIYSNEARVVPEIADVTGFPAAEIQKAYDRLIKQDGVFPVNEGLETARFQFTVARMKEIGLLPQGPPDLARVIDRGPIREAVQSLGAMKGDPRWH
ncbi:MAG TPA: ABC transporter substrate-binding protein [Candidatus Dormibacteraeota bacterium]|nr:ABC transporter substrate-binding protein [Candidatus Dormibacteraeota bacterium]